VGWKGKGFVGFAWFGRLEWDRNRLGCINIGVFWDGTAVNRPLRLDFLCWIVSYGFPGRRNWIKTHRVDQRVGRCY
jgi:hypothetical protein